MKLSRRITNQTPALLIALVMTLGMGSTSARAINLSLSDIPLYLGGNVAANIMFTLDDSGSMQWEILPEANRYFTLYMFPVPDGVYGGSVYTNQVPDFQDDNLHNFFGRSAANNAIFYNPDVTYTPWSNADGSSMAPANPKKALYNPVLPGVGTMDLTAKQTQYALWFWNTRNTDHGDANGTWKNLSYWPITYYNYDGSGNRDLRTSYTRVRITSGTPSSKSFTSPGGVVRTRDQEIRNFANWFQYYRSRVLLARAGIGQAFGSQGSNMRVGFAAINQGKKRIDGVQSKSSLISGVRRFAGTDRTNWFNQLYGHTIPQAGTPLRRAMDSAGRYFQRSDNRGPWGNTPGTKDTSPQSTCRQNYHILMTDGQWNGGDPFTSGAGKNVDGQKQPSITTPTSFQYKPVHPYEDDWSGTLGDVAMYFWSQDLRPGLANQVPPNALDPAYWQHMVNFTVGLGVVGNLNPATDLPALTNGTKSWSNPLPGSASAAKVDDLWHAALNSRGTFFSAKNPVQFTNGLSAVLNNINNRTSTASSVSRSGQSVGSRISTFLPEFKAGIWTGTIISRPLDLATGVQSALAWDAQTQVSAQNFDTGRKIVTLDPTPGGGGMPFRRGSLTPAQKGALNIDPDTGVPDVPTLRGQERLNYLRGKTGIPGFRLRPQGVLGDIIHSQALFVGPPNSRYPGFWGIDAPENGSLYSSFAASNSSRQSMVYAGANDGMLHAFDAATGNEKFAYVPNAVFSNLNRLTSPNYDLSHKYYVDGKSTAADVFFGGAWHTVLVGTLRAGGQGVYALDITDTNTVSEASLAANKVLWEFTDRDDADLGYTFSEVRIVRMHDGKWAAVFGNGYNNTVDNAKDGVAGDSVTGNAVLYIVDIETGALIKKIDTLQGMAQSANKTPNGLSSPVVVDTNHDSITDYVYAGDLQGNVWKFDLNDPDASKWGSAYLLTASPTSAPVPLFTATTADGARQPITAGMDVVLDHPPGTTTGSMVYFGTGKYFEPEDKSVSGQPTQTVYGIWDKGDWGPGTTAPPAGFSRNHLLQQKILQEVTTPKEARAVSNYLLGPLYKMVWHTDPGLPTGSPPTTQLGWYLDLINTDPGTAPLNNHGERLITMPVVKSGKVIFNTFIPPGNPCASGAIDGWLMMLNAFDGGNLPPGAGGLDANGDNKVNSGDYITVNYDANGDGVINGNDQVVVAGLKFGGGLGGVTIIDNPSIGDNNSRILSGPNKKSIVAGLGLPAGGRKSWIRLQ